MKAKKLLKNLSAFLAADEQTQQKQAKSIRKVLKALKEKERSLKKQLLAISDADEAQAIQTRLDVIYAQRNKGVALAKQLKESKGA
ncbi:MAG: hypothetical protein NWP69_09295 [Congregibacter sp.]|nr:hypothetical protein [Congregibacter sp.]